MTSAQGMRMMVSGGGRRGERETMVELNWPTSVKDSNSPLRADPALLTRTSTAQRQGMGDSKQEGYFFPGKRAPAYILLYPAQFKSIESTPTAEVNPTPKAHRGTATVTLMICGSLLTN